MQQKVVLAIRTRVMGSLHDSKIAHRGHEPEMPEPWAIKKGIFRFIGGDKPKLINSEIYVFEFLSSGFPWRFMESIKMRCASESLAALRVKVPSRLNMHDYTKT